MSGSVPGTPRWAVVAAHLPTWVVAPWGELVPRWVPRLGGRSSPVGAAVVPAGIGATVLTLLWTYSLAMVAAGRTVRGGTDLGLHLSPG